VGGYLAWGRLLPGATSVPPSLARGVKVVRPDKMNWTLSRADLALDTATQVWRKRAAMEDWFATPSLQET
jgi:predicted homoserine dehydrogenase-like protein